VKSQNREEEEIDLHAVCEEERQKNHFILGLNVFGVSEQAGQYQIRIVTTFRKESLISETVTLAITHWQSNVVPEDPMENQFIYRYYFWLNVHFMDVFPALCNCQRVTAGC
jgi:hypothetical protein